MLTIHHLGVSQSERIVWLCEELDIEYELIRYEHLPVTTLAPPEYKALHPLGTAPVITDGDVTLAESGAVIDYIVARYGDMRLMLPPDHPNFPDYLFWYHHGNASLMMAMMVAAPLPDEIGVKQIVQDRVQRGFAALNARLESSPWLAGDMFTVADIMALFPLTTMRRFTHYDLSPYPHILRYLERISDRAAFRRAMEKADPGQQLLMR